MTDTPHPPEIDFSHQDRATGLRETFHALWPYLLDQGRVLQADLAEQSADEQERYEKASLRKTILSQLADVLVEEGIIHVDVPEERRIQKEEMVYLELTAASQDGDGG